MNTSRRWNIVRLPSYSRSLTEWYFLVHAVLKETLRLFTSAPLVARTSREEPLVIPSTTTNLYLPPKTQIMMASLLTHKRQDLWGPDAEDFRPERWFEPALLDKVTRTPFMYAPFYGGPRVVSLPPLYSSFSISLLNDFFWIHSVSDRNSRSTKRDTLSCASCNASSLSASRPNLCPRVRCRPLIGKACRAARALRRSIRQSTLRCIARCVDKRCHSGWMLIACREM